MQVSQTSALTDRQEEERRILDLEDAVKSVSLMIIFINLKSNVPIHNYYVMFTTVILVLNSFAVAASFVFIHRVFLGV